MTELEQQLTNAFNRAVEAVRSGDGAAGRVGRRIAGARCSGSKNRSRT